MSRRRRVRYRGGFRRAPAGVPVGPEDRCTAWFDLADGSTVLLRPIEPGDKTALAEGFARLSERTRYQRFMAPMSRLTARQAKYLTEIDQVNHFAWVAGRRDAAGTDHGLGVTRYVRLPDAPQRAEFAVVVADDAQGIGLGRLLVEALAVVAADRGLTALEGLCFAENHAILHLLGRLGTKVSVDSPGVLKTTTPLPARISLGWRARRKLRRVARMAARN